MKKIIFILAIISSLFSSTEHTFESSNYFNNHIPKDLTCLKLNSSQHKTIKELLINHREKLFEFNKYKKEKETFLKDYIKEKNFNKKLYFEIKDEINKKALHIESDYLENIFTILNEKQREIFTSFMQEWKVE